jgi:hypothetical protein
VDVWFEGWAPKSHMSAELSLPVVPAAVGVFAQWQLSGWNREFRVATSPSATAAQLPFDDVISA